MEPMDVPAGRDEHVEWLVETDQTEDFFGTDERGAREWFSRCEDDPDWEPAVLRRRAVVTEIGEWETVA